MQEEDGAESANSSGELARPEAVAEAHDQACGREPEKCGEQNRVHVALLARKAHEEAAFGGGFRCRICRFQLRHSFLHWQHGSSPGNTASGSPTRWCGS